MSLSYALNLRPARKILLVALVSNMFAFCTLGQSVWTGSASCTATANGSFLDNNGGMGTFSYTETQTWAMTGAAPTSGLPFTSYPGVYTVTGSGFKQPSSGARQNYSTSYSTARVMQVAELSGGRWEVVPAQLTVSLAGTHIGGDPAVYNILELPFPVSASPTLPLQNPNSPNPNPPLSIVAEEPGGLHSSSGAPITENCNWYFGPPKPGSGFVSLTPCRLIDTRTSSGPLGGRGSFWFFPLSTPLTSTFQVAGHCGIPVSPTVTAYSLNVTAVPRGALNSLSIKPTGQSNAALSILSAPDGDPTANAAIVPALASGSVDVTVSSSSDVIIDVDGYFDSGIGNSFYLLPAVCRAVDTRSTSGPTSGAMLSGGVSQSFALQSSTCNIPANAQAYALSVTIAPAGFFGGLTIWPTGEASPNVSTLNAYDGQMKTNSALIQAGTAGEVTFLPYHATHLIVDIIGYFAPAGNPGALTYTPLTACQAANISLSAMTGQNLTMQGVCGSPYWAQAYVLNFTAAPSGPLTSLFAIPTGQTAPALSILSAGDGQVTASNTITGASSNASIMVVATGATVLRVDASGYFAQ